jgi:hypothetical protein
MNFQTSFLALVRPADQMNFQTSFLALVLLPADQKQWALVMHCCQSLIRLHLQTDGWMATALLQIHHTTARHRMKRWRY